MAGVIHSSDADSQRYYQESVRTQQKESEDKIEELKKAHEKELARLQKKHDQELSRVHKTADQTVEKSKESAQKILEEQKKNAYLEIQDLKNNIYKRDGKLASESNESKEQINGLQSEIQKQRKKYQDQFQTQENKFIQKNDELITEKDQEFQAFQNESAQRTNENQERARQKYAEQLKDLSKNHVSKEEKTVETLLQQMNEQKHAYEEAFKTSALENEKKQKAQEKYSENQQTKRAIAQQQELQELAEAYNINKSGEDVAQRENIQKFLDKSKDYFKGKAEGRSDAIADYEDEWMSKVNHVARSYEDILKAQKVNADTSENKQREVTSERLEAKDTESTQRLRKLTLEEELNRKELQGSYEKALKEKDLQLNKEKVSGEKRIEVAVDSLQKTNTEALMKQSEASKNSLSQQTQNAKEKELLLINELNMRKTTDDASFIPPLAAEKLKREIAQEYQKSLDSKTKSAKLNLEETQARFAENNRLDLNELKDREDKLIREKNLETQKALSEFNRHVENLENMSQTQKRELEVFQEKSFLKQNQLFDRALNDQKRHYEQVFNTMRIAQETKIAEMRETSEFDRQMMVRKMSQRFQDTLRENEKKLSEQKNHYEIEIGKIKGDKEFELQKLRSENRVMLEVQERHAQHRLESLKQSQLEREKNIQASYEKEMQNLRNSHDRLIRQKS